MAVFIENKKAYFNYSIEDKYEAGIELQGHEVKAIKNNKANINSSFCIIRGGEAYIIGMHIPPYQLNNIDPTYDPDRTRKLLLSKKEIKKLADKDSIKGLTLVPLSVYIKGRYIKISIGIGRGKKSADKRETIKKRETDIEIRREYKR